MADQSAKKQIVCDKCQVSMKASRSNPLVLQCEKCGHTQLNVEFLLSKVS
jgi:ribosomal protein L37AE/L43A